jgi:hypothetical protein
MIGVVDGIVMDAQIAFQSEVSFGNEHYVNVATGEKGLQFKDMLGEAICIP